MLRFKVGFVVVLSCLALVVGLFSSIGVASAHSTQALQSQVSTSTMVGNQDQARCQTFTIVRSRYRRFEDLATRRCKIGESFFGGHPGVFVFEGGRRFFHRVRTVNFETVTIITICPGHRRQVVRTFIV